MVGVETASFDHQFGLANGTESRRTTHRQAIVSHATEPGKPSTTLASAPPPKGKPGRTRRTLAGCCYVAAGVALVPVSALPALAVLLFVLGIARAAPVVAREVQGAAD